MRQELTEKQKKKIAYLQWSLIAIAVIVLMFLYEKPFEQEEIKEVFGKISNCFVVPGIVFAGVGGLSYISKLGGYDSFGYMFSNFALHSLITKQQPKKYKSLYDYKIEKDEKGRKWLPQTLFVGLGVLAIGIVLFVIYAIL